MSFWRDLFIRFKALFILLIVLVMIGLVGMALINSAPKVKRLFGVTIKSSAKNGYLKEGVILGWEELGQYAGANSAEKNHLKISYNTTQGWQLYNIAAHKRVDAQINNLPTRYIRRFALQAGDRLISEVFDLEVKQASQKKLILLDKKKNITVTWQGSSLSFSDQRSLYPACERKGLRRIAGEFRDSFLLYKGNEEKRLFTIGGQVDCTTRWKYTDLKPDSVRFLWMAGHFWIGPGKNTHRVRIERNTEKYNLDTLPLAVDGNDGKVQRLILGRTHYKLTASKEALVLEPTTNQPVFILKQDDENTGADISNDIKKENKEDQRVAAIEAEMKAAKRIKDMKERGIFPQFIQHDWIGDIPSGRRISFINFVLAWAVTFLLVGFIITFRQGYHPAIRSLRVTGLFITLVFAGVASFVAYYQASLGIFLGMAWVMALWATIIQFLSGRLVGMAMRIWLLAVLLASIGLLVLTQLAVGSDNTRWLGFPSETAFWLTQLSIWVALLSLAPLENVLESLMNLLHPDKQGFRLGRFNFPHFSYLLLIVIVGGLLITQSIEGKEEGVFGIQPVELAKLLFIIAMARLLWFWRQIRLIFSEHFQTNWFSITIKLFSKIFLALLFAAAILMLGVNDNSPIFIVGLLTLALLWLAFIDPLEKNASSQWWGQGGIVVILASILFIGFWFYTDPPDHTSWIPQAERFRIWSNPLLYPEAASQLLNSLQRIGEGGWTGTGWFGKNSIVMTLPAVQDDFIGAFLLNRFGGFVGVILIIIQFLWLLTLFRLSSWLRTIDTSPNIEAAFQLLGYVIYGLAWLHLLHWLISWSNVLGWLPIMGQPMTWLSSGNSHLLAVGITTLLLALVGGWLKQIEGEKIGF